MQTHLDYSQMGYTSIQISLDNKFQIREAMHDSCDLINLKTEVFEKALLALVLHLWSNLSSR